MNEDAKIIQWIICGGRLDTCSQVYGVSPDYILSLAPEGHVFSDFIPRKRKKLLLKRNRARLVKKREKKKKLKLLKKLKKLIAKKKSRKKIKSTSLFIKKWRENNPLKVTAHRRVYVALRNKTLSKSPCNECGNTNVQAHHEDYLKPLEVVWLCKEHHVDADKARRIRVKQNQLCTNIDAVV